MWGGPLWVVALLSVASTKAQYYDGDMQSPSNVKEVYVINGQDAVVGQFPHHALLIIDDKHICGGSLISKKAILTAAHCIFWNQKFIVRLGTVRRMEEEPTAWITVTTLCRLHPEYNVETTHNDVAVIFLTETPPVNRYIKLVALPSFFDVNKTFAGRYPYLSGFGKTAIDEPRSEILQWTQVKVVTNYMCKRHYNPGVIIESILCAHSINSSACYGDSGSPLVLKRGRRYKQIGVVNFGPEKCETHIPTAYARVTSFIKWIKNTIKSRNVQLDLSVA